MLTGYLLLVGKWSDLPYLEYKIHLLEFLIELLCNSTESCNCFDQGLSFLKNVLVECKELPIRKQVSKV